MQDALAALAGAAPQTSPVLLANDIAKPFEACNDDAQADTSGWAGRTGVGAQSSRSKLTLSVDAQIEEDVFWPEC